MTTNWKLGLSFALLTAVMWGLLPLGLEGVLGAMDPLTISWYRFSLSAVIALAWYGRNSGLAIRTLLSAPHRSWTCLAVLGLAGNYLLYIWGLDFTNPGAAQILIQVAPLLLVVASVVFFRERFGKLQWLGVLGFTVGMLLFFHHRIANTQQTEADYNWGILLLILAALSWTGYGIAQKKLLQDFHAKDILLAICLGGSVLFLPLAHPAQVFELNLQQLALLIFTGINTIVAYGAFGLAMSHWEASRVSAVIPLAPLLTLFFSYLLNHWFDIAIPSEPLDWLTVVGAVLVVLGSALAATSGNKPNLSTNQ